jgi:glutathione S-transferase
MTIVLAGIAASHVAKILDGRFFAQLKIVDEHLAKNKWFAGDQLSAADCMMMCSFSTLRGFSPFNLGPYPNVLRWMKDVAERPAYKRALEKGDDGMAPMIEPVTRKFTHFPRFKEALEKVEV